MIIHDKLRLYKSSMCLFHSVLSIVCQLAKDKLRYFESYGNFALIVVLSKDFGVDKIHYASQI